MPALFAAEIQILYFGKKSTILAKERLCCSPAADPAYAMRTESRREIQEVRRGTLQWATIIHIF